MSDVKLGIGLASGMFFHAPAGALPPSNSSSERALVVSLAESTFAESLAATVESLAVESALAESATMSVV